MATLLPHIQRKIVVLNEKSSARDAARAMKANEVGCVLVGDDEGRLTGIVTDRDFACRLVADSPSLDVPVSSFMTHDPAVVPDDARVAEAARIMETHGVRRIPVVSSENGELRCIGLVTLDDFLSHRALDTTQIARIVQRQTSQRTRKGLTRAPLRREERSQAHAQQTLDRFYREIGKATDLPANLVPAVSYVILSSFCKRLDPQSAAHFIAQLPKYLQTPMFNLPAGPDRKITANLVAGELVSRFQFLEEYSRYLLNSFCSALPRVINKDQVELLKIRLPLDMRRLFEPLEEEMPVVPATGLHLKLTSASLKDGEHFPRIFTQEGANRSPELRWSQVPAGTREFAVVCKDIDSKPRPWTHWVAYGIPANVTQIPEGIPARASMDLPIRMRQGRNSSGNLGYIGPMPARGSGMHRYIFRVYALDREISLPPGASQEELFLEMRGHVLAEGSLTGRYSREALKKTA